MVFLANEFLIQGDRAEVGLKITGVIIMNLGFLMKIL
jgi:hypothetical protein